MKRVISFLIPLLILAMGIGVYQYMNSAKPQARVVPPKKSQAIGVDAVKITNTSYPVLLHVQGITKAQQETTLVSEVSGKVQKISPSFVSGKLVKAGETLVALDTKKYRAAVAIAQAEVDRSMALLVEEQARATLAIANWERSKNAGEPSALTKREPQLQAAQANIETAKNRLIQAKIDLAATSIVAPYDGVIVDTSANLGQLATPNTQLGSIMSTAKLEIRIPLSGRDISMLAPLPVDISVEASLGDKVYRYPGKLLRQEAVLDEATRQIHFIAEVAKPYEYERPIIPGQFVKLIIPAMEIENVTLLPITSVSANSSVATIEDDILKRKQIELVYSTKKEAVVRGLEDGELVILSPVDLLPDGTKVRVKEQIQSTNLSTENE